MPIIDRHKSERISEDDMLNKMLELGMIVKSDCGYVASYKEDLGLWSRNRASKVLSEEFGYRRRTHHTPIAFMKKFNRVCEENMIKWPKGSGGDRRFYPQLFYSVYDAEEAFGIDLDKCDRTLRVRIGKRWSKIQRINVDKQAAIERYRKTLMAKNPEIFVNPKCHRSDQTSVFQPEDIVLVSGMLQSYHNCYYDDHYGKSYDETLNEDR